MSNVLPASLEQELLEWIPRAERDGAHFLSSGYQGRVLFYDNGQERLAIKVPSYRGIGRWISIWMLRREARVYERLSGLSGVPRCHGLLCGRYLVLQYIEGENLRNASIPDRDVFYGELLRVIRTMHARGVAHADLKRRDNIMVDGDSRPWLLDFGAASIRRSRGPINRRLFNIARQFDLNAWVKHKYQRQLDQASERDRRYLHRTWLERSAARIKQWWHWLVRGRR